MEGRGASRSERRLSVCGWLTVAVIAVSTIFCWVRHDARFDETLSGFDVALCLPYAAGITKLGQLLGGSLGWAMIIAFCAEAAAFPSFARFPGILSLSKRLKSYASIPASYERDVSMIDAVSDRRTGVPAYAKETVRLLYMPAAFRGTCMLPTVNATFYGLSTKLGGLELTVPNVWMGAAASAVLAISCLMLLAAEYSSGKGWRRFVPGAFTLAASAATCWFCFTSCVLSLYILCAFATQTAMRLIGRIGKAGE
jgi:hypothetical protein